MAQLVKNLPAMWRPGFNPWVGKIPLEEGMATHSSILAWKIPMDRGAWQVAVHGGRDESDTTERLSTALSKVTNANFCGLHA